MLQVRGEYMAKSDYRYEDGTIFDIIRKDASIISEYAAELNPDQFVRGGASNL